MKARPILMNTQMVQATLKGDKSQTRRLIPNSMFEVELWSANKNINNPKIKNICRYGKVGDLLWVRETFSKDLDGYIYKASCPWWDSLSKAFNKPSIFMPRVASRLTLEIIDIRVERLRDISRGDCMEEGCPFPNIACETNPVEWYRDLWESINGKGSWEANPWVWVVEFKVHKCNVDEFIRGAK